jgi:hypothetical protein
MAGSRCCDAWAFVTSLQHTLVGRPCATLRNHSVQVLWTIRLTPSEQCGMGSYNHAHAQMSVRKIWLEVCCSYINLELQRGSEGEGASTSTLNTAAMRLSTWTVQSQHSDRRTRSVNFCCDEKRDQESIKAYKIIERLDRSQYTVVDLAQKRDSEEVLPSLWPDLPREC